MVKQEDETSGTVEVVPHPSRDGSPARKVTITLYGVVWKNFLHPLVMTNSLLLKIAIEIMSFPLNMMDLSIVM